MTYSIRIHRNAAEYTVQVAGKTFLQRQLWDLYHLDEKQLEATLELISDYWLQQRSKSHD